MAAFFDKHSERHYQSCPRVSLIDEAPGPQLTALLKTHKLSDSEFQTIRQILGRSPTMCELGTFSAMWSEHCSYKSSRVHLKRFPTKGPNVVVGPGENAGVVRLSGKLCVAFKMESHNHPSYIEPYQGAATGVGGILRDVFCMGARPIANLNALRFGDRSHPRTPLLVPRVVKGIGDYGNCVGVPTVGGNISFDPSYNGNCLVNAMNIGIIHEDRIFKGYASGPGNLVVYVGSATGRDGIHGATMASDSFASQNGSSKTTVQVGDPFTEKLLLEATLEVLELGLVVGLQDMGAAGLTSSSFEMAGRAGNGLLLDLDHVPVRTEAMTAYELLLSESQERMLMVIEPNKWSELKTILDRWLLSSAVIGKVTDTGMVKIYHQGQLEVEVPVAPMTDAAPVYERPMRPRTSSPNQVSFDRDIINKIRSLGLPKVLGLMLQDTGDKTDIHLQYDKHIGARTVRGPEDQGAAVLWMRSDFADPSQPWLGVAATTVCNERYCREDPYLGAAHAVIKSARTITASGGEPLAITDCLNYGNPEVPEVMWEFSQGVDGISMACRELDIPVVSGNVSLYNETDGASIAPTPMIGMVGRVPDVRHCPTARAKVGGPVYLLVPKGQIPALGGSLVAKTVDKAGPGSRGGKIPQINWPGERESMSFLRRLTGIGALVTLRDIGDGGIVTTAAKMALSGEFAISLDFAPCIENTHELDLWSFGEWAGAYLMVVKESSLALALQEAELLEYNAVVPLGTLSKVCDSSVISWGIGPKNLDFAKLKWNDAKRSFSHSI